MRIRVKICGVTRPEDAARAAILGADAIGLNFYPKSTRYVSVEQARDIVSAVPPMVETFGVFVGAGAEKIREILELTGVSSVQLHDDSPAGVAVELAPRRVVRVFRWQKERTPTDIDSYLSDCRRVGARPVGLLVDAYVPGEPGGTGHSWAWEETRQAPRLLPIILAGGLTPDNVAHAIEAAQPWGVDVAGGVEAEPGIKDLGKMRAFIEAVRSTDS